MGLSKRQEMFVAEYAVDHNATKAAIRAGYSPRTARPQGSRLTKNVAVSQAIERLDQERRARLGIDKEWIDAQLVAVFEKSMAGAPRTDRYGKPVKVEIKGETRIIYDWSPAGANKSLELLARNLGLNVERHQIELTGDVVYTLTLDRDLELHEDDGEGS